MMQNTHSSYEDVTHFLSSKPITSCVDPAMEINTTQLSNPPKTLDNHSPTKNLKDQNTKEKFQVTPSIFNVKHCKSIGGGSLLPLHTDTMTYIPYIT